VRRIGQGTGCPVAPVPDQRAADAHPRTDTPGSRARTYADVSVRGVLDPARRARDQGVAREEDRRNGKRGRTGTGYGSGNERGWRRCSDATEEVDVRAPMVASRSGES